MTILGGQFIGTRSARSAASTTEIDYRFWSSMARQPRTSSSHYCMNSGIPPPTETTKVGPQREISRPRTFIILWLVRAQPINNYRLIFFVGRFSIRLTRKVKNATKLFAHFFEDVMHVKKREFNSSPSNSSPSTIWQNIDTSSITLPPPDLAHLKEKGKGAPHPLFLPGQKSRHANTQLRGVNGRINHCRYVLRKYDLAEGR